MNNLNIKIDIENIALDMYRQRFANDHKYTEDIQRKGVLSKLLAIPSIKKEDLRNANEADALLYAKTWNHLKPYHRRNKMEEYVNREFCNENLRKELIEKLGNLIENSKLKSNVEYDHRKQKIDFLYGLSFSKDNKLVISE